MSAVEKWNELRSLGKAKFIWRERVLIIGLPVGVVYSLLFGDLTISSWRELHSRSTIVGLWIPLLTSILASIVVGIAEWAEAEEKASEEVKASGS